MSRFASAGVVLIAAVVLSCALAAVAAEAKDPKKDPRRTYSTEGWKLAWSDEFDGRALCPAPRTGGPRSV